MNFSLTAISSLSISSRKFFLKSLMERELNRLYYIHLLHNLSSSYETTILKKLEHCRDTKSSCWYVIPSDFSVEVFPLTT